MLQAQTLGLVKIHPRSGAFVRSLSYAPLVDALTETLESSLLETDRNLFHLLEAPAHRRRIGVAGRAAAPIGGAASAARIFASHVRGHRRRRLPGVHRGRCAFSFGDCGNRGQLGAADHAASDLELAATLPDESALDRRAASPHRPLARRDLRGIGGGRRREARARIDAHLGMAYTSLLAYVRNPPQRKAATATA